MKVTQNMVVALQYELEVDGQIADKCSEEQPLTYIQGKGMLLPKFEAAVEGLEPGQTFKFTLSPAEGYGEYNPEMVIELPKEAFVVNGQMRDDLMQVGVTVPLVSPEGGMIPGVVKEVLEKVVLIDLNPRMAGKTLNFSGKVVSVREATEKELNGGCSGGCGGGGCKGDGSCGSCSDDEEDAGCGECSCGCDR